MATPTLTSVAPNASRSAGGVMVKMLGTNFQLPFSPPVTGPTTPLPPSVRVTFGANPSTRVMVVSSTELRVLVPPGVPGAAAVKVENIDQAGVLIPGETVTQAAFYTYSLPDLSREATATRVIRTLLQLLKSQILPNVSLTVHTDYDSTTSDNLNFIEVASLPAIVITGPALEENRFFSLNQPRYETDVDGFAYQLPPAYTVDLTFTLTGVTESTVQLVNLIHEVAMFFSRNPYLNVQKDESDVSKGSVRYEMTLLQGSDPQTATTPNLRNVRQFNATFVVRGVDLDDAEGSVNVTRPLLDYTPPGSIEPARPYVGFSAVQRDED